MTAGSRRVLAIRPGRRYPRTGFAQPLGLLSIIAVLRDRFPGLLHFRLVEQALYDLGTDDVARIMRDYRPQLVLMSCMSVEGNELRALCALAKRLYPDVPVWIGGPHATMFYDRELETGYVDAACIGEGEATIVEMVERWLAGRPLDDVTGLALLREGKVVTTPQRPYIEDLDSLPLPAWDLVDFEMYGRQISLNGYSRRMPWAVFLTSRACPYRCIYCHNIFGKKVRFRGLTSVMEELELLTRRHGVKEIHIADDIFNIDLARAKSFCDEIVRRGIRVSIALPTGLRADRMDRELIEKLKAAGCYTITYAVETASPRLQRLIRKNLDLDKVRQVIDWTDQQGLITQGYFMIGFPGETVQEMRQTVRFALASPLTRAFFLTVVVHPRTALFELAKKEHPGFDLQDYDPFDLRFWAEVPFYTRVTGIDTFRIQRDAYRAFYLRPSVLFRILTRYPKNRWFFRGIYWGVRSCFSTASRVEQRLYPLARWIGGKLMPHRAGDM